MSPSSPAIPPESLPGSVSECMRKPPHENSHQQGARKRRGHILVRIPFIPLRAEIRSTQIGTHGLRDERFNEFKQSTLGQDAADEKVDRPNTTHSTGSHEQFLRRIDQQETEGKMDDTVERVSAQRQGILHPETKWNFRIGVMRSHRVESHKQCDEQVRKRRKSKSSMGRDQRADQGEGQHIF